MGSDRRNRERRPARGAPSKNVKRRLLIVCEGEVTEPEYFRGFERWARNNTVQIDIPIKRSQGLALVERATKLKREAESTAKREADAFVAYDEVWCALDVDENDNRMLREYLSGYDKHLDFEQVSLGVVEATRRARRLDADAQADGESGRNPTTGVFRLTDSIARDDSRPAMASC